MGHHVGAALLRTHRDERLTKQTRRRLVLLARRELLEQALHCLTELRLGLVSAEVSSTEEEVLIIRPAKKTSYVGACRCEDVQQSAPELELHHFPVAIEIWCDQLAHGCNAWPVEARGLRQAESAQRVSAGAACWRKRVSYLVTEASEIDHPLPIVLAQRVIQLESPHDPNAIRPASPVSSVGELDMCGSTQCSWDRD